MQCIWMFPNYMYSSLRPCASSPWTGHFFFPRHLPHKLCSLLHLYLFTFWTSLSWSTPCPSHILQLALHQYYCKDIVYQGSTIIIIVIASPIIWVMYERLKTLTAFLLSGDLACEEEMQDNAKTQLSVNWFKVTNSIQHLIATYLCHNSPLIQLWGSLIDARF